MLVTMKNSDLIDRLVLLADGNIDLVREAIRSTANRADGGADLKQVVEFIVKSREPIAACGYPSCLLFRHRLR
jgi:hypothetical protein